MGLKAVFALGLAILLLGCVSGTEPYDDSTVEPPAETVDDSQLDDTDSGTEFEEEEEEVEEELEGEVDDGTGGSKEVGEESEGAGEEESGESEEGEETEGSDEEGPTTIGPDLLSPIEPGKTWFIVEVPSTTPSDSVVYIQWYDYENDLWCSSDEMIEMSKHEEGRWQVQIELGPEAYGADGEYFYYRYTLDQMGYEGAEQFPLDHPNAYRKLTIEGAADMAVGDMVGAWRNP
ncbi:hypothetical protein DRN67_03390 [Candidatus Micrarchaeota archaeon]|nr:MAG: hypothetical protein DRN67_03390 [Candidatus Micrarchaeota archaeon]